MATVTATDFLVATGTPGLWVRLHNNVSGTDYYSTAVSDPQGAFTYTVPTGEYSLYVGSAATVPGTPTLRNGHFQVAVRNGDDAALNSGTFQSTGPYTPDFPGGVTNPVTRGSSDFTYDKGGMFVNVNGPKYRNIGTWDPVAGSGDATAAINQAIIDGIPVFPPNGFYNVTGVINNPNSVPLITLGGGTAFSGSGAPVANVIRLGLSNSLFVSSTGSDSNLGIGPGAPFLTLQRAMNVASAMAGLGIAPTIYVASGSYAGAVLSSNGLSFNASGTFGPPPGILISGGYGGGTTTITRAPGTLACLSAFGYGATILVGANITFTSTSSGLYAQAGGIIGIVGACTFGACTLEHMHADYNGLITISSSYTISGSAASHFGFSLRGSIIFSEVNYTVTLTGSPVFATAFAYLSDESLLYIPSGNITFSGAAGATTPRFLIRRSATLETNGGGPTYLPGTTVGQVLDQGRYYPTPAPSVGSLSAGWGTGATALVLGNDREGLIVVTTGTTPGASASLTLTGSFVGPIANNFGAAVFQLANNGGAFNARATVIGTGSTNTPSITITVDNNAVNFPAGVTLSILYITRPF